MLPFLKNKQGGSGSSLLIKQRAPDNPEAESNDPNASIDACSQDLIAAVHARDTKAVSEAIRSAFLILESEPHEEAAQEPYEGQE